MKFLLDTCVLSELVKPQPDKGVISWMSERTVSELHVSAMTLAEIERGIARLAASRRQADLTHWLRQLKVGFESRVLPFTAETASAWAQMCAALEAQGKPMAAFDSIIAASAIEHGMTLVTRNVSDFKNAPLVLLNPWRENAADSSG